MKLIKFRVTNFRSVEDSGWVAADDVTALIGVNESGKTNLLLPLWKLNPAKEGEINLLADAPRKRYNELKNMDRKPKFIEAHFELPDDLVRQIVSLTGAAEEDVRVASVSRSFAGTHFIGFPNATAVRSLPRAEVEDLLTQAQRELGSLASVSKAEEGLKEAMLSALADAQAEARARGDEVGDAVLKGIKTRLDAVETGEAAKRSTIAPRFGQLVDGVNAMVARVSKPLPYSNEQARDLVLEHLPSFVYYSNYGNLDSEIYLPHVIQNMRRDDLGNREASKVRTLKVLFDFVRLEPDEILELGRDFPVNQGRPTEDQIKAIGDKKKEREILLQSASTELTQKFRDWWKQGDYRLRFQADGDHFRIWVSDDKRPEEIELEGRSTGLQWFLSFYLIFLVESADAHQGAILLLDEPGLSLHPLSQKDLSRFFENLAQTNQILYTTHSPFMVDANHLDRVRSVYVDDRGATVASPNLRASEADPSQSKSIYAVHAALGLTVSDSILQGCQPVIVEGPSDQFYLNGIKNFLIREGLISPKRELVFVPAGGVRGVSAVVSILAAKGEALPYVVVDSDRSGQDLANKLRSGSYQGQGDRLLLVGDFCNMPGAEVEDLIPTDFLADVVSRKLRGPEEDFDEVVESGRPILPQIEAYARNNGLTLGDGWKVEIAKQAKARLQRSSNLQKGAPEVVEMWKEIFARFD
ncbi:MAG: ATP-binding protein [Chloroflexota bacterium]|nr:ATP-binding protein [Chloroflexota bacterium]